MNFFGHYFTDSIKGNPYYNIGLIYPDLFRDLFRQNLPNGNIKFSSEEANSFVKGINSHLNRDKSFHASTYFKTAEQKLKEELLSRGVYNKIPRNWFMIHVLVELMTDRNLVMKYPQVAESFYDDMGKFLLDKQAIDSFFESKEPRFVFLSRLRIIQEDRYIFAYSNKDKLIQVLWRIYQRVGIEISVEMKEECSLVLSNLIEDLGENACFDWSEFNKLNS